MEKRPSEQQGGDHLGEATKINWGLNFRKYPNKGKLWMNMHGPRSFSRGKRYTWVVRNPIAHR